MSYKQPKIIGNEFFGITGGVTPGIYTLDLNPDLISYSDGLQITVKFTLGCLTTATINVNGIGVVPIATSDGNAAIGAAISSGEVLMLVYSTLPTPQFRITTKIPAGVVPPTPPYTGTEFYYETTNYDNFGGYLVSSATASGPAINAVPLDGKVIRVLFHTNNASTAGGGVTLTLPGTWSFASGVVKNGQTAGVSDDTYLDTDDIRANQVMTLVWFDNRWQIQGGLYLGNEFYGATSLVAGPGGEYQVSLNHNRFQAGVSPLVPYVGQEIRVLFSYSSIVPATIRLLSAGGNTNIIPIMGSDGFQIAPTVINTGEVMELVYLDAATAGVEQFRVIGKYPSGGGAVVTGDEYYYTATGNGSFMPYQIMQPAPALTDGFNCRVQFTSGNTIIPTLQFNNAGPVYPINKNGNNALAAGDIISSEVFELVYDQAAVAFQVIGKISSGGTALPSGTAGDNLVWNGSAWVSEPAGGNWANATGVDTYVANSFQYASGAYVNGRVYNITFQSANTASSTLNINAIGAKPITKNDRQPVLGGDIKASESFSLLYNAAYDEFQLLGKYATLAPKNLYGEILIATGNGTYSVTFPTPPVLTDGFTFYVYFISSNIAGGIRLNINGNVYILDNQVGSALSAYQILAGDVWKVVYSQVTGRFNLISPINPYGYYALARRVNPASASPLALGNEAPYNRFYYIDFIASQHATLAYTINLVSFRDEITVFIITYIHDTGHSLIINDFAGAQFFTLNTGVFTPNLTINTSGVYRFRYIYILNAFLIF